MCLAVPMRVYSIDPNTASGTVAMGNTSIEVGFELVPDVKIGDYVLIHAGMAIQIIEEEEAQETLRVYQEFAEIPGLIVPESDKANG